MRERLSAPPLRIRRGTAADAGFIREVATDVFQHLGDYGRILPTWLLHDGVLTHVAEEAGVAVGYTMLGFYPLGTAGASGLVADLLAIAVSSRAQGRGVGRKLLQHAINHVRDAQKRLPVREIKLSVADNNARARKLFSEFGFTLVPGEHGYYDGGQVALHMSRVV
jgi:[ribosomal protein S18]-alanine N-acetyltransferase